MSFTIEITDEYTVKVIEKNSDKSNIKYIEVDDLIDILKASKTIIKRDEHKLLFRSPILTSFDDVSTIQYIVVSNNIQYIVIKKNEGKHDFALGNKMFKQMNLPTLIFTFKIYDGVIMSGYVCCVKDPIVIESTKIYYYPFGNVYSDGHICFGGNNMANHKICDYTQLHSMPSRFLLMPTSDTYTQKSKYKMVTNELCEYLTNNKFDKEMLLEYNNLTFENYIKKVTNTCI